MSFYDFGQFTILYANYRIDPSSSLRVEFKYGSVCIVFFRFQMYPHPPTLEDNAMSDYHVLPAQRLTGAVRVASSRSA